MAKVDRTMHDVDILDQVFRGVRAPAAMAEETPLQNFHGRAARDSEDAADAPAARRRPRSRRRSRSSR
ncbi:MAG TPA: hypothetical protein VK886_13510 [Vicinamibacterales bacterium]|nr:hypothetical protein [Vicinamibacterales bacterium]